MATTTTSRPQQTDRTGYVGSIPIRNLWLLMLYASDLFRQLGDRRVGAEDNPDDIPDLVAEILAHAVEQRLNRNLSFGYRRRNAELSRIRGRIDALKTERGQLLSRGRIACRFDDLTVDTPRNRFVRAALEIVSTLVRRSELAHRCRVLASSLQQLGVVGERPGRAEMSTDRIGRHDQNDQLMVAAAWLAFDLELPTEARGLKSLIMPDRDIGWLRRLYEQAVGGFYAVVLSHEGWQVKMGRVMRWPIEQKSPGIDAIFPTMRTDIELDHPAEGKRIIIDTKFTGLIKSGQYGKESLSSQYIYQIYAYLRSQESSADPVSMQASGLLLHPAVDAMVDEAVRVQGHEIRFATVDLGASPQTIRTQLLRCVEPGLTNAAS